jgi:hypothetical protein
MNTERITVNYAVEFLQFSSTSLANALCSIKTTDHDSTFDILNALLTYKQ